ncbi:MAG: hypothetical protein ACK56W_02700 [Pirellula sp.]|nr:hypothetical protein [Pirellula sp.]
MIANASAQSYLPGSKVYLDFEIGIEVDPTSSEIVIPPTSGNAIFSGGQLWYVPEGNGTADAFVVVFNAGGKDIFLTQLIEGENTSSTLSFAVSTQDGSYNVASTPIYSTLDSPLTITDGELPRVYGAFATISSGSFAMSTFATTMVGDWGEWFHGQVNYWFPGSVENNSSVPVLVWSDTTGHYYLPPGSTSPEGDCADYIFVDDTWYKIMGPIHGHCFINPSGPPTSTPEWDFDVSTGATIPPNPLTPVAEGQYSPPEPVWIQIGWGV